MTHRLATNYAKNYCNRTPIVKVIVENVVTCFFGTQCSYIKPPWSDAHGWASECPDVKNYKWWFKPVWQRRGCLYMSIYIPIEQTVGVKRLTTAQLSYRRQLNRAMVTYM